MKAHIQEILEEQRKKIKVDGTIAQDPHCPFTGSLKLHGKVFQGIVVSKDTHRTAKVSWTNRQFVKKYERFLEKKTKVAVHNPEVIDAEVGDRVIIAECRPLSKTKRFVVIKNLGHSLEYAIKQEAIEDDQKVVQASKKSSSNDTEDEVSDKEQKE